ncbi:MAG: hypothetical protein AVDCRST_MAG52-1448, partial [uncultured Blastococcus sp.]
GCAAVMAAHQYGRGGGSLHAVLRQRHLQRLDGGAQAAPCNGPAAEPHPWTSRHGAGGGRSGLERRSCNTRRGGCERPHRPAPLCRRLWTRGRAGPGGAARV